MIAIAPAAAAKPPGEPAIQLHAYVLFDGNCRDAMRFYQSVFGGGLELQAVADTPMAAAVPVAWAQRTIHARLTAEGFDLSASDWLAVGDAPSRGNMNALYIEGGAPAQMRILFEKLSRHGKVVTPLAEQPFGWYGRLVDSYGVIWMFHTDARAVTGDAGVRAQTNKEPNPR